jgi:SOS-response transcriptional repressor LexA
MPAVVIPIGAKRPLQAMDRGYWSLLEVAQPGRRPLPYGILLADRETGELTLRLADLQLFDELDEQDLDFLEALPADLQQKGREMGGLGLMDWLEDSLSHFLRVSDREAIAYGDARETVDRLFDEHVDATVRPFVSHLPVYSLRAAATKFGEGMDSEQEGWVRAPEKLRLSEGMFVAYVVGRSMEPLIPDGSACIFRAPVTGLRKGRLLLIEKAGETDFASRYTVKRYARQGVLAESADREGAIRLEPLNREFPAFDLTSDEFRVIAEFVQVLRS